MKSMITSRNVIIALSAFYLIMRCSTDEDPVIPKPEPKFPPKGVLTRGYNFETKEFIPMYPEGSVTKHSHYMTDEEIRNLRQDNPDYIIKVPGRTVLSKEREFEAQMEDYIEDHHEEIIEKYKD